MSDGMSNLRCYLVNTYNSTIHSSSSISFQLSSFNSINEDFRAKVFGKIIKTIRERQKAKVHMLAAMLKAYR